MIGVHVVGLHVFGLFRKRRVVTVAGLTLFRLHFLRRRGFFVAPCAGNAFGDMNIGEVGGGDWNRGSECKGSKDQAVLN